MNFLTSFKEKLKSREGRRRAATITVAVFSVLLVVFAVFDVFSIQHVRWIVVNGESRYTDEEIIEASGIKTGELLYSVNKKETEQKILDGAPYVKKVSIIRAFATVFINLTSDEPKYYTEVSGEYFILSKDLRVLERRLTKGDAENLTKLILPELSTVVVGRYAEYGETGKNGYVTETLGYFSEIYKGEKITEIGLANRFDGVYAIFDDKIKIIFGDADNFEELKDKASRAQEIFEKNRSSDEKTVINVTSKDKMTVRKVEKFD